MLVNRRTGKPLAKNVEIADTFFKRAIGLMFRGSYDGALVFPRVGKTSFHGFFCFFPITLICLDAKNRVIDVKTLKPWSAVNVNCETVIEMDARNNPDVREGDELIWHEG